MHVSLPVAAAVATTGWACVRSLGMGETSQTSQGASTSGLSLAPLRGLRYTGSAQRLGHLLCPPYDVVDEPRRRKLLEGDPRNAVALVLPEAEDGADPYQHAATELDAWLADGTLGVDQQPALYVYEMQTASGGRTRGLLGAVELRAYADGVVLPHENTMAGPVADRLALMTATQANLEPIYLVYDGGGAASLAVADVDKLEPVAIARTPDGTTHRLWALTEPALHRRIEADLAQRRAMIADGHHRYATYLELQARYRAERGAGPWDRGLTLLVDSSSYGPEVHAIHRVLAGLDLAEALRGAAGLCRVADAPGPAEALVLAGAVPGFAAVLTDGHRTALISELDARLRTGLLEPGEPAALADLDVTVLHRGLLGSLWGLTDTVENVRYAHSVDEAVALAAEVGGCAVLLRPTPVAAVAAVAAAGGRMPRKSTLFTPKPASGLVMRRFVDQP